MRRLARYLFPPLARLSLLACVAACVLWVRSFGYYDVVKYAGGDNRVDFSVSSDRGIVVFDRWSTSNHYAPLRWNFDVYPSDDGWRFQYPTGYRFGKEWSVDGGFNRFGFAWSPQTASLSVPHWFIVLLTGIAPAAHLARHIRRSRRGSRCLCASCGYDLRATPERCPECGAISSRNSRTEHSVGGEF